MPKTYSDSHPRRHSSDRTTERLERGNMRGVSEDVLDSIARALQLDEAEHMHLFDLARAADTAPHRRSCRRPTQERVRPVVQRILDSLVDVPAFVRNERLDVLAAIQLGAAFSDTEYQRPPERDE